MSELLDIEYFDIHSWLDGEEYEGVPKRIDGYRPGHLSWGKSVERGRAIQRAREKKARATNMDYFLSEVFPAIEDKLGSGQLIQIAKLFESPEILKMSGFRLWEGGGQIAFLKIGDPVEKQASAMGATVVEDPVIKDGYWTRGES